MPKSASSPKPDDVTTPRPLSDVALRKKKNADAQAAFRARRAAYISTLEATVNNLESIVLSLQDSCREARGEAQELRQENARLKLELREREKFWRAMWPRKSGSSESDLPPPPPLSQTSSMNGQMHVFTNENVAYRPSDDPAVCSGQFNNPGYSSSLPYTVEGDDPQRAPKYAPYYSVHGSRDGPWPQSITHSSSSGGESGVPASSSHSSHSPPFGESPQLTSSDMAYVPRFPVEDQKIPINNIETNLYEAFPGSRSISPSSASATSLTSPFPFSFNENPAGDRTDFDYRRQSHPHSPEVTLHGGTADLSVVAGEGVRYRLGARRPASGSDHSLLPVLPPLSGSETGSQHERGSSDGDSYPSSRLRTRRSGAQSRSSRSPSPGTAPPLSGTLAVIKAQAFGALRRTRARTKKHSDSGPAKVAIDVLESRGMGVGSKRPRLDDDDADATPS